MSNVSILSKLAGMSKTVVTDSKVEMTEKQFAQCKAALREKNRGYNVQPNKFDVATPYRVSINYNNKWNNFGNFKCDHTAAAVGAIVSLAFFGENAKQGDYDAEIVTNSQEFKDWLADSRNQRVIAMANGDLPSMNKGGSLDDGEAAPVAGVDTDENPF